MTEVLAKQIAELTGLSRVVISVISASASQICSVWVLAGGSTVGY